MLKKFIKMCHVVGAVGVMGSFAASIVLVATATRDSPIAYAATRQGIAAIAKWLLVPSLAVVVISGLLAIAFNKAYVNAGWAWVKALLGISVFEGTLLTVASSARHAAELSAMTVSGNGDPTQLAEVLRTEWGGLWILMTLSFVNIVLAVWRPRFGRRHRPTPSPAE